MVKVKSLARRYRQLRDDKREQELRAAIEQLTDSTHRSYALYERVVVDIELALILRQRTVGKYARMNRHAAYEQLWKRGYRFHSYGGLYGGRVQPDVTIRARGSLAPTRPIH